MYLLGSSLRAQLHGFALPHGAESRKAGSKGLVSPTSTRLVWVAHGTFQYVLRFESRKSLSLSLFLSLSLSVSLCLSLFLSPSETSDNSTLVQAVVRVVWMKGILNASQEVLHQVDHAGTSDRCLSLRFRVLGAFRV